VRLHGNARLSLRARERLVRRVVDEGWSLAAAAGAADTSTKTARKWVRRFQAEGPAGLLDRSTRPHRSPRATPADRVAAVEALRRARLVAPDIAAQLSMPVSTVCVILRRLGLQRLANLDPPEPVCRYERRHPGELLHVDIKPLARITEVGHRIHGDRSRRIQGHGIEYVHVAVDDTTRLAYVEVLDTQRAIDAVGFLRRAIAWFAARGVTVERVMTDNGSAYVSTAWKIACGRVGIRHLRTRPYRPQTNGKAERFIGTLTRSWAYGAVYQTSVQRRQALLPWVDYYNNRRPHSALGHRPPAARLTDFTENNLCATNN
jgi:transposase InsO family protein